MCYSDSELLSQYSAMVRALICTVTSLFKHVMLLTPHRLQALRSDLQLFRDRCKHLDTAYYPVEIIHT